MMGPQGMNPYSGNPWGLDPSYGSAYSMPAGLPPGLVMPLMPSQGAPGGGLGPAPPGFPYGGGSYARPPSSQPPPKSKYPSSSLPTEAKRPVPNGPNKRK